MPGLAETPLQYVKGVGPKKAALLAKLDTLNAVLKKK